jgi:hypothetical protein
MLRTGSGVSKTGSDEETQRMLEIIGRLFRSHSDNRKSAIQRQQIFCIPEFPLYRGVALMKKTVLSIALLFAVLSGCSSVISDSERFYKDRPRERINWREYEDN